jgi:DNA polymerase type B, organellar and viral
LNFINLYNTNKNIFVFVKILTIEFGKTKSVIVSAVMYKDMNFISNSGSEFNFHHNVLIDSTSTFNQYYNEIADSVNNKLEYGYGYDVIEYYKVKVWNLDLMENAKIKIHNKGKIELLGHRSYSTGYVKKSNLAITPIKVDKETNNFATMDIETMNVNGTQIPVAISTCNGFKKSSSKLFVIDHVLLKSDPTLAVNNLWKEYFDYIINKGDVLIFAHNLGNFDGYYLYRGLLNHFDPIIVQCLIDDNKTFISITLNINNMKIVWKDSIRIFPMSLDKLCKLFNIEGKLTKYDPRFNELSLFNNSRVWGVFKNYALQDAIVLFKALFLAQNYYYSDFKVDITTIFSSPTLSLKIFRYKILSLSIPILTKDVDEFVRLGYYGGGTDLYKAYATNLKYYDVNSLYPHAMNNPMPHKLIRFHKNMDNINLDNFFGYIEVEVTCPTSMMRPVLPFKFEGNTIYPVGTWTAIYFSEELKAVQPLGYEFRLIQGYEFSKANIFNSYVDHFFNIKRNSVGTQKAIAKLHLNGLYGYFGRRQDLIETVNVRNNNLHNYFATRIIKDIMKINEDYSTLLLSANINHNALRKLNIVCESNIKATNRLVMSNVAIAAAVTSYARIHMIYYKLLPGTVYSDTDSIFTTRTLLQ